MNGYDKLEANTRTHGQHEMSAVKSVVTHKVQRSSRREVDMRSLKVTKTIGRVTKEGTKRSLMDRA